MNINKQKAFLFLAMVLLFNIVWSQNAKDRQQIISETNTQALQKIINKAKKNDAINFAKAKQRKLPLTKKNANGDIGSFFGFDTNGKAIYAYDDNVKAAISGRTNKIWEGGSSGLNLNGAGIEIGVWERGYARSSHQEFQGRQSNGDNGGSVTSHATHTGGTLIAAGIDPEARGMASGASIRNHTMPGIVAEAASFAANGGILTNNSNTPSGTGYNSLAKNMDEVIYNAPYYLHCKSAGNEGSDYATIFASQTTKNMLVVGNCQDVSNYTGPSSVVLHTSSSRGPTNDWRIKPDITNNGRSVYSSDSGSNSDYGTKTGTSMSTPATAGSIALLQQHYKNLNGVYMKSATAKALVINTADEMGNADGPDFASGWGLLNAERAAQVISNNGTTALIEELSLSNGGNYTATFYSDGTNPLDLTIAWNDPAGSISISTNPVLVNDLDLRVTGNGNTYSPWTMVANSNFDNYSVAASKGDNFRDNIEKIDTVLPAGNYTITVTHKGNLQDGAQDFSLIINGININPDIEAPSTPLNLIASNITGNSLNLSWTPSTDNVAIDYYEIFQNGSSLDTSSTASFIVNGLISNTTYSYYINAIDTSGNNSPNSNTITITTLPPPPCGGIINFPYSESFEIGYGVWTNGTDDDIEWTLDSNGTPSNGTGPSTGQEGDFYLYTEASGNGTGYPTKTAILNSPCIELGSITNPQFQFGYHMKGNNIGSLQLLVSTDNSVTFSEIWSINDSQGDDWNEASIDLTPYLENVVNLQFKATTGSSWSSDIAIDNFKIILGIADTEMPTAPTNLTASNITQTTAVLSWTASTDNIGVTGYNILQDGINIGTTLNTSFDVSGLIANTSYNLAVSAFDATENTSTNSNTVAITTLENSSCTGINSFPYTESFESDFGLWTNATGDDIEWTRDSGGTPSNGTGPSTGQDGNFYLYTEASRNGVGYPTKTAILNSHCIDLTNTTNPELQFGYHMRGNNVGTLQILVSSNDGITFNDIWAINGSQGNAWNQATLDLTSYAGSIINIQFKATTGPSWSSDIAIDNIKILSLNNKVSMDDNHLYNKISIYPNPVNNEVFISLDDRFLHKDISIVIYNNLGRQLKTVNNVETNNAIDISQFPSGLYFLTIINEKGLIIGRKKIIKK